MGAPLKKWMTNTLSSTTTTTTTTALPFHDLAASPPRVKRERERERGGWIRLVPTTGSSSLHLQILFSPREESEEEEERDREGEREREKEREREREREFR